MRTLSNLLLLACLWMWGVETKRTGRKNGNVPLLSKRKNPRRVDDVYDIVVWYICLFVTRTMYERIIGVDDNHGSALAVVIPFSKFSPLPFIMLAG
jgi:hypothetical protein